jgi:tRNA (adenine37-N6)-methyltransferase
VAASEFPEGLRDLEGFSHLFLIYAFRRCPSYHLTVTPFLDIIPLGVFATRAPRRPNAIGLSTVRLIEVNGTTLVIEDVDILDRTPLLDLKPYVPAFDSQRAGSFQSDERFR